LLMRQIVIFLGDRYKCGGDRILRGRGTKHQKKHDKGMVTQSFLIRELVSVRYCSVGRALPSPRPFACVASICSPLPTGYSRLGSPRSEAGHCHPCPVEIFTAKGRSRLLASVLGKEKVQMLSGERVALPRQPMRCSFALLRRLGKNLACPNYGTYAAAMRHHPAKWVGRDGTEPVSGQLSTKPLCPVRSACR
jgi:hypothetical protein